jgi:hypothetical protein
LAGEAFVAGGAFVVEAGRAGATDLPAGGFFLVALAGAAAVFLAAALGAGPFLTSVFLEVDPAVFAGGDALAPAAFFVVDAAAFFVAVTSTSFKVLSVAGWRPR